MYAKTHNDNGEYSYDNEYFETIENIDMNIIDEAFGTYSFRFSKDEETEPFILQIGAPGTYIIYDYVLYESDTDFKKLIQLIEREKIERLLDNL